MDDPRRTPLDGASASVEPPFASSASSSSATSTSSSSSPSRHRRRTTFWSQLRHYAGPGFLVSLAYLDPGNIEADLQSGAYAGYQLLWVLLWSTAAGLLLQVFAVRLGVVTGCHLAQLCRQEFPFFTRLILWFMTELAIIGSDIQEVVGSAIAFKILFGWPLWVGCLVTGLDCLTFLALHRLGMGKLEALFAAIILAMLVAFCCELVWAAPRVFGVPSGNNSGGILFGTAVPTTADYSLLQAVGLLGSVIMPVRY